MTRIRVTAEVEGLDQFDAAVARLMDRIDDAGRAIAVESLAVVERRAKGNFEGSHPRGMPHVGGAKPNIVSGTLRRSIRQTPVRRAGAQAWAGSVGPTTVYGRRIELGYPGGEGRGRQRTRPFPYLKPAVVESYDDIRGIGRRHWAAAVLRT